MDYTQLLEKLEKRKSYFLTLNFQQHSEDLDLAIKAIRSLLIEKENLKKELSSIEQKSEENV